MKVLVTGGTGFIGASFCRALAAEGHEILALIRNPKKAGSLPKDKIEFLRGDLSIFQDKNLEIPECDVVVHLAAALTVKNQEDYSVNYTTVVDFVECLARQKWKPRRFVFASSLAAGGPTSYGAPLTEDSADSPVEEYGRSKLEAEQYLKSAPFPTTSFRPPMVMGPGSVPVLALFQMAKAGVGVTVTGIDQEVSFIHVDDLAEAILAMCGEESPEHKTYYTAHEQIVTTSSMWKIFGKVFGKKIVVVKIPKVVLRGIAESMTVLSKIFDFDNRVDMKRYKMMTQPAFTCLGEKLHNDLGWKASRDFERTVSDSLAGYKKMGWL